MQATQSDYNRNYYLAHPELREKARDRERLRRTHAKAFQLSKKKSTSKGLPGRNSETRTSIFIELLLLPLLLACLTYLLLQEMASFYVTSDGTIALAWIKAIALETSVLVFSFLGSSNAFAKVLYKLVAISICIFSTYAMCANHYSAGVSLVRNDQILERAISDLEVSISEKRIQRDQFREKGWLGASRKAEHSIELLQEKLAELRSKYMSTKPATATTSTTLALIFFRILLMVSNILVADRFRITLKNLENLRTEFEVSIQNLKLSKSLNEISRAERKSPSKRMSGGVGEWSQNWIGSWERMKV